MKLIYGSTERHPCRAVYFLHIFFLLLVGLTDSAIACPLLDGLVDFNCDGEFKAAVVGDSIVRGIGDLQFNNNGGYVLRLQKQFKKSKFVNLGLPGYSTDRLLSEFQTKLRSKKINKFKKGFDGVDLIIIDAGRNDFFAELEDGMTVRNLKRLSDFLRRESGKLNRGLQPYVAIAALLPTTRGFQREFIDTINATLFEVSSGNFPVLFPFNQLDPALISVDGIHPDSDGYKAIALIAKETLTTSVYTNMLFFRPDSDDDGIYDKFEKRFKTNTAKKDTDGDKLSDGEEVFQYETDPLTADTDGDGANDGAEVAAGTDPLVPGESAPAPSAELSFLWN